MEEKNVIKRSELREKVRKILVGTLLNEGEKVSDNLLDTVIKYYFPKQIKNLVDGKERISFKAQEVTEEEKNFLEQNYIKLIEEKEKENIKKEIENINEIKVIVSAFSLSRKNSLLEEYTFEKDLRVFNNIEKIYLLYTKETEYKFKNYLEKCEFKEKIEGIEVDGRTVDEIYKELKELVLKNKINKNNTILDITLGMKTISIAFYRIAVERQLKAINWNEKFLSSYAMINENEFVENKNGPTPRIALSAKLNLMREPIKESMGIYSRINNNIRKGNYEIVSDFYEIIGVSDLAFFYKKLNEIFDIELENNSENFYKKLEKKVEEIEKYQNFENKNKDKIKEIMKYFLKLIINFEKGNFERIKWLNFNNNYGIKIPKTEAEKNSLDQEIEEFDSEKYFQYLKVKYKVIRTKEELSNIADDLAFRLPKYQEKIDGIEEVEDREKFLLKVKNTLYSYLTDEDIENFKIEMYLEENIEVKIKFFNNKLVIPNLKFKNDLEIDFINDKFWEQRNNVVKNEINMHKKTLKKIVRNQETYIHKPIIELLKGLSNGIYEVKSSRVKELLKAENTKDVVSQNQKMRALINIINEIIKYKSIIKEREDIGENFILYSEARNGDYSIKISDKWKI